MAGITEPRIDDDRLPVPGEPIDATLVFCESHEGGVRFDLALTDGRYTTITLTPADVDQLLVARGFTPTPTE
jgi:hypothetical protein